MIHFILGCFSEVKFIITTYMLFKTFFMKDLCFKNNTVVFLNFKYSKNIGHKWINSFELIDSLLFYSGELHSPKGLNLKMVVPHSPYIVDHIVNGKWK